MVVVGAVLAMTFMALKPKQEANIAADKMKQILSSVHVTADDATVKDTYAKYISESFIVNEKGDKVAGDAFDVNIAAQSKIGAAQRLLPVFVCHLEDNTTKYILPVYGAGLWGPIWGYVAVDDNGSTIFGAYFSHQGETPGLGAEIAKPEFQKQFDGKNLYINGEFKSIGVMKAGQKPTNGGEYVNAVSGGTITSKGVQSMLQSSLSAYNAFFKKLQESSKH